MMSKGTYFTNKETGEQYRLGGFRPSSKPSTAKGSRQFENLGLQSAYEFLIKKCSSKHVDVSRLFIYYNARDNEGNSYEDDGTTIVSAAEALDQLGCCKEETWPYDSSRVGQKPSKQAYEEAMRYRLSEKIFVDTELGTMKACLAQGYPFVFGILLFESFGQAETNGTVPLPRENEKEGSNGHGWHAMLAVGYSDKSKCFIVRNSYGEKWGDKGYCYIPYDYMTNPKLCLEAHAVRAVRRDEPQTVQSNTLPYPITDPVWTGTSAPPFLPTLPANWGWSSMDTTDIYGWDKNKANTNYSIETTKREETEKQPQTSNDPHILWIDNESEDPLCRHLKAESGVNIAFCETIAMAEEYLSKNIQYIKNCRSFQIVCRGYYKSENKNPLNILHLVDKNRISCSTPILVYTRDKSGVEKWLAQSPTQAWRQRLFITDSAEAAFNHIKNGWKSGTS
ncbi:unnamed protein product [Didymodactylos carnosus]|uniref:Peptidase C1A papain C-terminal domain-containing protein n=1 Tax=Didymodactylos carnosus TaxID=1234261 RepID=A0A8S2CPA2_9BILA|nr:unnamed protein product [Didymodactylos carnosus]CAF3546836.1 unnamed protein product [Didymodactylos carnosus]